MRTLLIDEGDCVFIKALPAAYLIVSLTLNL